MTLTNEMEIKIREHSLKESPNECCGLILSKDSSFLIHECENDAVDKLENFKINAEDYLKATLSGDIVGYYHSHTNDNTNFTPLDKAVSDSNDLPLVMYHVKNNKFFIHRKNNG